MRGFQDATAVAQQNCRGTVWFARNTHDTSRQRWNERVERAFASGYAIERSYFAPYSALDQLAMRLAGWAEQPSHVIELLEMRCLGDNILPGR
jgi:ribosome modulation factor